MRIELLSCHYNSASLRLLAPFLADAQLVDAVPHPFTSLFHSCLSPLDIFSRFTAALKAWFNHWLTVPVCSYFYLPQSASSQLIYASRTLVQWARLCGPTMVRFSRTNIVNPSSSRTEANTPLQSLPAFVGVPPCPELVVPQPPASASDSIRFAQATLDMLRAEVFAQPELCVDVLGIAEAMAVRCEAARKEMAAAQGGVWENDMWDAAAQQMWMKKARVEKWCEAAAVTGPDRENQPHVSLAGCGETMNMPVGWSSERFGSQDDQNSWQWESDMFNGIDCDADFLDMDWSAEEIGDMTLMGGLGVRG